MKKIFALAGYITIDGIDSAMKKLDTFEKKARKAIRPVQRFGQQTAQIGKTITTTFTVPLAVAGGAAVKFGADFEKAMTNSLAIMEDTSEGMKSSLEDTARSVAKTTTFSATQAAEAYYFLASAGMDAAQSMEALPRVAKFAQAGNFDLAQATDLLTDAQSSLGLASDDTAESMENLTRISDVLVKANTIANASVQQFSEALTNRAGAALRLVGKSVEEGAAVLAVFADQGTKGAEAGTKLDIVLRDLQKASINNKKAFKEAGIAVFDANGNLNNMADIVADLEERFSDMSDEQRRAELMTLGFTDKSVAATASLIGFSEKIKEYEEVLAEAGGTTERVANKQLESLSAQWTILKNKIIDVGIELAQTLIPIIKDSLLPAVEGTVKWVSNLAKWFSSLPVGVKETIVTFTGLVAIAGPMLIILGKLISSVTLVTTAIKAAKLAMIAFNTTLLSNPFGLVVVGIAAVTGAVIGLRKEMKKAREEHKEFKMQTLDQAARQAFIDGVTEMTGKLKALGEAMKDESSLSKELGDDVNFLTNKAREMGYVIEGNTTEKLKALITIQGELTGAVDFATGKTIKYTHEKKKETEAIKENTQATKDNNKAKAEWLEKLSQQGKEGVELIEAQRVAEVNRAKEDKENAATIAAINRYYANEKKAYLDEEAKKTKEINEKKQEDLKKAARAEMQYFNQLEISVAQASGDQLRALEIQIAAEKRAAEESLRTKEDVTRAKELIDEKYYMKLKSLREEESRNQSIMGRIDQAFHRFMADERVQIAIGLYNQLLSLVQMAQQNEMMEIDQQRQRDIQHAQATIKTKADQEKAIERINAEADSKKRKAAHKQAKAGKAASLFEIAINTASAAMGAYKAMSSIPYVGPILGAIAAGVVTAFGAVQAGLVMAQPLPALAEGGVVKQTRGGRQVIVGEGNDDEAILPMRKGAAAIADNIMSKIGNMFMAEVNAPPGGRGSNGRSYSGSSGRSMRPIQHNWNIGTLVADDRGIKELERRQLAFRVEETHRKGQD